VITMILVCVLVANLDTFKLLIIRVGKGKKGKEGAESHECLRLHKRSSLKD
jgi:hypothetical protein